VREIEVEVEVEVKVSDLPKHIYSIYKFMLTVTSYP
jgi:(p)ppGpp synthase/HD superfamily hydrolase